MEPELHADLEALSFLVGTWIGEGKGEYPGIEPFRYGEELRFSHGGKAFLAYAQRTWSLDGDGPLHSESGFWRPQPGFGLEIVVAHPFGLVEVSEGSIEGRRITLASRHLVPTSTSDPVEGFSRAYDGTDGSLSYVCAMASSGHSLRRHLEARLIRTDD